MTLKDKLAKLARDIDLAQVEVMPSPDITALDAQRVRNYPVSAPRHAESERAEFADGLLTRVHAEDGRERLAS
jgi:hypothetical protein